MSQDTLLHRCLRPVVGRLAGTAITPDGLTVLRLSTGVAAAGCFAAGRARPLAVGAGVFLVSMLLDRADGELARQSQRFSRIGARFDLWSDGIATMAVFLGLGIGVPAPWLPPSAGPWLGIVAAVSAGLTFMQMGGPPMAEPPDVSRRFDADDAMLLIPPAIWLGGASWVLLAAGVLTPIAAFTVTVLNVSRRAQARQSRDRRSVSTS